MIQWLFGPNLTPAEEVRRHQRTINKAIRELDRERAKMQQNEKKVILEIKKSAKAGQINAVRVMAKDLVRTRKHVEKMYKMKVELQVVSMRLQSVVSQNVMAESMKGVTKAMVKLNQRINLPATQNIMLEFAKQSEVLIGKEEIISDTMDDTMEDSDNDIETEAIVNQVLDEIGINLEGQLASVPTSEPFIPKTSVTATQEMDDTELEKRLENLRKN